MKRWIASLLLACAAYFAATAVVHPPLYFQGRAQIKAENALLPPPRPVVAAGPEDPIEIRPAFGPPQFGGIPVLIVGFDALVLILWLGLLWRFQRRVLAKGQDRGIGAWQVGLPLVAFVASLPLAYRYVYWNMFVAF